MTNVQLRGGQDYVKGRASRVLAPDQGEGKRDDRLDRYEYRSLEPRAEGCAYVEHDAEALADSLSAEIGVGVGPFRAASRRTSATQEGLSGLIGRI
jgi:hypothetical protein